MKLSPEEIGRIGAEFFGQKYLCAESVLVGVAQWRGKEGEEFSGLATGFCSGLARTCGTCGVVNGGIMALGLCYGPRAADASPDPLYSMVRSFIEQFSQLHGSANCRELIGIDLSTDAGKAAYKEQDTYAICRGYVADACRIVAELIDAYERSNA